MSHSTNTQINDILHLIESTWGLTVEDDRITEWMEELASGEGRTIEELRKDIFKHVVGDDKVKEWIIAEMDAVNMEYDDERLARIMEELTSGQRNFSDFRADVEAATGNTSSGTDTAPAEDSTPGVDTEDSSQATREAETGGDKGFGGFGEDPLTILTSEEMEWFFDPKTGKWYVVYGLPNSDLTLVFEVDPDQMDALFGENIRPERVDSSLEALLANGTFGGNVGAMEGVGSLEDEIRRVMLVALDDGILPDWAGESGVVMDLLYIAQSEEKGLDWLILQISKTEEFEARFVGLANFQTTSNLTLTEAIAGYLEYEASVEAALIANGFDDIDVTPELIGSMLDAGHQIGVVTSAIEKYKRMKEYAPAMEAFNRILEEQGLAPILTAQDLFDFVSGQASGEIYDIWEASSMSEAAAAAGLGDVFTAEDAMAFAMETEGSISLSDLSGAFKEAASLLLRMRHQVDVGQFGIETDDLIDLSLGRAIRSGVDGSLLMDNINRAVLSAQKSLQARSKPQRSLGERGRTSATSLKQFRDVG